MHPSLLHRYHLQQREVPRGRAYFQDTQYGILNSRLKAIAKHPAIITKEIYGDVLVGKICRSNVERDMYRVERKYSRYSSEKGIGHWKK